MRLHACKRRAGLSSPAHDATAARVLCMKRLDYGCSCAAGARVAAASMCSAYSRCSLAVTGPGVVTGLPQAAACTPPITRPSTWAERQRACARTMLSVRRLQCSCPATCGGPAALAHLPHWREARKRACHKGLVGAVHLQSRVAPCQLHQVHKAYACARALAWTNCTVTRCLLVRALWWRVLARPMPPARSMSTQLPLLPGPRRSPSQTQGCPAVRTAAARDPV